MAQKVITSLIDDLDGNSEATETVVFALGEKIYEIDLSEKNASKFRTQLAPYIDSARRVQASRAGGQRSKGASGGSEDSSAIREWARAQGYEVNDRGRIPSELRAAYEKDR
ncbi:Lsr2 family protein [Streptomyces sp. NPDC048489]|uniref:histone-like nucleoid-structuring protein Lsr2 n=1 Tax=Streptomyces sp. NPDC048489 TaxID=3154504 RepID=UPI00343ABBC5